MGNERVTGLPRLVVVGAGGHAAPVLETLLAMGGWGVAGLVDAAPRVAEVLGHPILGDESLLPALRRDGVTGAVIAIGDNAARARLGALCRGMGFLLPPLLHPSALISAHARLGEGVQVMARAVIGPRVEIEELALVNTGAIVEHDSRIGAAAHLGPGSVLCGGSQVGARALIGAGAVLRPLSLVGEDAVVAPGAAVAAEVTAGARVGGVPARPLPG